MSLSFLVDGDDHQMQPDIVVIVGFTGRDRAAVREHIVELQELGVPTPDTTPSYYPAPPSAAVQTDVVKVIQSETSGEAEAVIVTSDGQRWLTLGSDHTDRAAESLDIALSKIVCPKPLARTAWSYESVADHLDALELRSWITDDADEVLYQEGTLAEIVALDEIMDGAPFTRTPDRLVMFTGTLPAIGGIRPASRFRATLSDPITDRIIELDYRIDVLNMLD